jgi:hypothetical protein
VVLLFNVFGEISSYFVMTCPTVYSLAIKAFTADWTVASKGVPAHNVIANNLDFWHTHKLATTSLRNTSPANCQAARRQTTELLLLLVCVRSA